MYNKELHNSAESGDAEAMYELAMSYVRGDGIEKDPDEAFDWLEKAANLGNAKAQHELADIYREEEDFTEAFQWEQKAAEQGFPEAQYNLAIHYRDGIGTTANPKQAFFWYQKAATNGVLEAKDSLANCYLNGSGTSQDFAQAIYWLEQASNEGHAGAKTKLGLAYVEGKGVPADEGKGAALLQEAAELGDEIAKKAIKEIDKENKPSRTGMTKYLIFMIVGGVVGAIVGISIVETMFWEDLVFGFQISFGIGYISPWVGYIILTFLGIGIGTWGSYAKDEIWVHRITNRQLREQGRKTGGVVGFIFIFALLSKLFFRFFVSPHIAIYRLLKLCGKSTVMAVVVVIIVAISIPTVVTMIIWTGRV